MSNLFDIKDLNFVIAGGLGQVGLKLSEHLEKMDQNGDTRFI